MNFDTHIFNSMPDDDILSDIVELHKDIFGNSNDLINKMGSKPQLLIITAMNGVVQTKTMNKWRNMLVLNIKNGFDVIDTYTDEKGIHKIILEKNLLNLKGS
ncbi:hypothetical protein RRV45_10165 [Bacillus sp. DTU_2020_1000418_1_SI_GHA_SEK_038]|uniref:hypothetical protein n=1 Tax=Bacillus sp. DTU_2020_1000418_1_SI_GHA_SEK_038 TaxID=3077585 RepID=UPI0028E29B50|nr:hypothetical protein [Bacillus sp. DTU_2020_1000418_1_SI_GHA_SEK_038]WNS77324.1 hypothetical protein RRV45_10165 [Bacillus sp. DTU_2020_1000418_1_SI_GHA_SEK_038]